MNLSLEASAKCDAMQENSRGESPKKFKDAHKKAHLVQDIFLGAGSLRALGACGYGLYWVNGRCLRRTLKPAIQLTFIGSFMTALYCCVVKFVARHVVAKAKEEIDTLGN